MVAIKTLAISALCVVGMTNAQLLNSLTSGLTSLVDNTNFPVAFAQTCNNFQDIIKANNDLLSLYYARGGVCLPAQRAEISKTYTCPSGAVGYLSSISWAPEYERLKSQQGTIRAQVACLTYFATGRA